MNKLLLSAKKKGEEQWSKMPYIPGQLISILELKQPKHYLLFCQEGIWFNLDRETKGLFPPSLTEVQKEGSAKAVECTN